MDSLTRGQAALARHGDARWLVAALRASRADTLATFSATQQALLAAARAVPQAPQYNPPLWELGHIGWFQSHWIARQPEAERRRGWDADPDCPRLPAPRADADALYDSSHVPHANRWDLPLPDADATRADLAQQLDETVATVNELPHDDRALYFARLVLLHEDMHHEAALYMAQSLGLAIDAARWQPPALPAPAAALRFGASRWRLGREAQGFAFDNEWPAHEVDVQACEIDAQVVRWADYLPFIDGGGYHDPLWWSDAGHAWLLQAGAVDPLPLHLRRDGHGGWQHRHFGRWLALDPARPACHLTAFEAEAWCAWAGRRLPTEAEWERAAVSRPDSFDWGAVWEWTASRFDAYPGFVAHPYRDYSAPWFRSRPVLRGASFATQPRLRDARYRNYHTAERNDVFAGFRSCAR